MNEVSKIPNELPSFNWMLSQEFLQLSDSIEDEFGEVLSKGFGTSSTLPQGMVARIVELGLTQESIPFNVRETWKRNAQAQTDALNRYFSRGDDGLSLNTKMIVILTILVWFGYGVDIYLGERS